MAIFPEEEEERPGELTDDDVYNQIAQLPYGTTRRDLEQIKSIDRNQLPQVKAYCTAGYAACMRFTVVGFTDWNHCLSF
jgi:hypothetical protein